MSQPLAPESQVWSAPRFYVTPRQRLSPGPFLLALIIAVACLFAVLYALNHSGHTHLHTGKSGGSGGSRSADSGSASGAAADSDDDDPSSVDTIYLADPSEAPVAHRPPAQPTTETSAHPTTVHPFVVIQLPRSGDQVGQIPDTPTGHLLYDWLAAFNNKDRSIVANALPTADPAQTEAAQLELRKQTGGFTLISAKEVQPGVLVFRLHDQTPSFTEFLGTLQSRSDASPPAIASFSLRAVPQAQPRQALNPAPLPR